jgi:hypothetical protein
MKTFTLDSKNANLTGKKEGHNFFKANQTSGVFFQPKLTVGPANDEYEQEADAVADKVMRMSDHEQIQTKISPVTISRKCSKCEEEEQLQRKEDGKSDEQSEVPSIVSNVLGSAGSPLDGNSRSFMENRFGYDFGSVKIHTDAMAAKSAQSINALAYTSGNRIVFNEGQYSPSTQSGMKLLAHELTHVVQQSASPALAQRISRLTRAESLAYGQSLDTRYPNWLNVLPNCPCRYADAIASPDWTNPDPTNFTTSWFHPGAATQVRSARGYQSITGTSHGQQCCYDDAGNLITEGAGAGTPDVWTPVTHFSDHQTYDVGTFNQLGWRIYTQYWRPNQGSGCAPNAGGGRRVGSGRYRIVGAFEEIDLFILSIPLRTVTESENIQVMATGREHGGMVGGRGHYTHVEVVPMNSAATTLFGGDGPRYIPSYILQPIP